MPNIEKILEKMKAARTTMLWFWSSMSAKVLETRLRRPTKGLQKLLEGWIETKLENGLPVPLPAAPENYSGKFMLRLPKSLHARLASAAQEEGVSLNQYALYKLSS